MMRRLLRIFLDDRGATAAEYVLVMAVVGAAIAVAAITLGETIANSMNASSGKILNCGGRC